MTNPGILPMDKPRTYVVYFTAILLCGSMTMPDRMLLPQG